MRALRCKGHDGVEFITLHYRYFVRCELCKAWRLRRRGEVFWQHTTGRTQSHPDFKVRVPQ